MNLNLNIISTKILRLTTFWQLLDLSSYLEIMVFIHLKIFGRTYLVMSGENLRKRLLNTVAFRFRNYSLKSSVCIMRHLVISRSVNPWLQPKEIRFHIYPNLFGLKRALLSKLSSQGLPSY